MATTVRDFARLFSVRGNSPIASVIGTILLFGAALVVIGFVPSGQLDFALAVAALSTAATALGLVLFTNRRRSG